MTKEEKCLLSVVAGGLIITEQGRIYRTGRTSASGSWHPYPEPRRVDRPDHLGYCRFSFRHGGKPYVAYAHRVVWVHHNGAIPPGLEVNHKDGDKTHNALANLELVTRKGNQQHATKVTKSWKGQVNPAGEDHPCAILNWEKVREIRRLFATGEHTRKALGEKFGVTYGNINHIVRGKSWREKAAV